MNLVDRVTKTYAYGKIFNYDRSLIEIHRWLIGKKKVSQSSFFKKISKTEIKYRLKTKKNLYSDRKIKLIKRELSWILKFPLIYFLGVTGSVSANNAKKNDDIDVFVVTAPHSLWLVRPLFLLYLEIRGLRRKRNTPHSNQKDLVCTNLWMDVSNLYLRKKDHNLYTAHEVLQVHPISNKKNTYEKFLATNRWVKNYLANAYSATNIHKKTFKNESFLWVVLSPLNCLAYLSQKILMFPISKGERVTYGQAFFHDQNFSQKVLSKQNGNKINYNKTR